MKQKLLLLIITLSLVVALLTPALAAEEKAAAKIDVYIHNTLLTADVDPYLDKGRVLVPLRAMSEELDFDVAWDAAERKVTITDSDTEIILWIESTKVLVNGKTSTIDMPATIRNGRTFIPVRFVSEQLGQRVYWVKGQVHVFANIAAPVAAQKVSVSSAAELLREIGPNKHIILKEGVYDLTKAIQGLKSSDYLAVQEVFDGQELVIKNVDGLIIEGAGDDKTELIVSPRYADVLSFVQCKNIAIKNLKAGHSPEEGSCTGGVIYIEASHNMTIESCLLYGCGTEGISVNTSFDISVQDSVIEHCTNQLMSIESSRNVFVDNCIFRESDLYYGFYFLNINSVYFSDCEITNINTVSDPYFSFFEANLSKDIYFINSILRNNIGQQDPLDMEQITFEGCTIKDNSFDSVFGIHK